MDAVAVIDAEPVEGHCSELTTAGCRIPYELRPIQCTAYFCSDTIEELSDEERTTGIRALSGLMGVQIKTVLLAIRVKSWAREGLGSIITTEGSGALSRTFDTR